MDMNVIGSQNGLPPERGDGTATVRSAQTDTPQAATAPASTNASGAVAAATTPKAYESPVVKIDPTTGAAVLSFRNPGSDEQAFQVPSRTALEYERQQRLTIHSANDTGAKA